MKFFRDDQVGQKSGNTCRCTVKQPSLATFVREYMPDTSQLFWYCRATQFYKFTRVLKGVDEHNTSVAGGRSLESMEDTTSTSITTDGFLQQVECEPDKDSGMEDINDFCPSGTEGGHWRVHP
jgi:hypothetical protein